MQRGACSFSYGYANRLCRVVNKKTSFSVIIREAPKKRSPINYEQ